MSKNIILDTGNLYDKYINKNITLENGNLFYDDSLTEEEGIFKLLQELAVAWQTICKQQSIIEELLKTTDGVAIIPGKTIVYGLVEISNSEEQGCGIVGARIVQFENDNIWLQDAVTLEGEISWREPPNGWFSTREAAEKDQYEQELLEEAT